MRTLAPTLVVLLLAAACVSNPTEPSLPTSEWGATTTVEIPVDGTPTSFDLSDPLGRIAVVIDGESRLLELPESLQDLRAPVHGGEAYEITDDGTLVVRWPDGTTRTHGVNALPDGQVAVGPGGLLAVLTDPSERYPHGILGDRLEATRVVVLDPASGDVVWEYALEGAEVFEALAPSWRDVDGDGVPEVLLTVSGPGEGARLVALSDGGVLAASASIGIGNRWRHFLTVGDFGQGREAVDVRTPHIGGIVEFFSLPDLGITVTLPGYSTHVSGSRNLGQWVAADLTGDGTLELVVPSNDQWSLGVLRRVAGGVEEIARLEVGGRLTTDLVLIPTGDGLVLLAGRDGAVRAWVVP